MRQYKPVLYQYVLSNLLVSVIAGAIIPFIVFQIIFAMPFGYSLGWSLGFVPIWNIATLIQYGYQTIRIQDGVVSGPGRWWTRAFIPITAIDWSKSGPITGWQRWFRNESIVSNGGQKILLDYALNEQLRDSLWQALKGTE